MRPELLGRQDQDAFAVERLAATTAHTRRRAAADAAPITDCNLQRLDVDVGRDLHLQDVPVDVLRHHRRTRHERRRPIIDGVVGRPVVALARRAQPAGHLRHGRAQRAGDRLRSGQRAIATDDDRVPLRRHRRPPRLGANGEQRERENGYECGGERPGASHAP